MSEKERSRLDIHRQDNGSLHPLLQSGSLAEELCVVEQHANSDDPTTHFLNTECLFCVYVCVITTTLKCNYYNQCSPPCPFVVLVTVMFADNTRCSLVGELSNTLHQPYHKEKKKRMDPLLLLLLSSLMTE